MTYPIQSGLSFRAALIGESRQNTFLFAEQLRSGQTSGCLLFNSSSITPPWGKLSNLWTPCVYSLRPRVPVEYELDEFNTPHTGTTLSRLQHWLCRLRCKSPLRNLVTSPLGYIFWRHLRFSPKQPEPQTHGDYNRFCPQTANTTFATLWQTYFPHTFNNALT